ncbi:MAG: methyltransferase domain-containing protein [Novosphingobium sp.]|nr:methyltransferase domain-containing protein [Novosphingobium sp.]
MAFARKFAEQLARPTGSAGRLLGRAMDIANRKPTRLAVEMLAPRAGEHILDAGCGTGAAMAEVLGRANCRLTGIDPSPTMLLAAGKRLGNSVTLASGAIGKLPFEERTFDAALALNVLYFCDAEGRMLADLRRTLRPGGRCVAYVTHRDTMQHWPFARQGLHRLFDGPALSAMFEAAGFAREQIQVHEMPITRSVRGLLAYAER